MMKHKFEDFENKLREYLQANPDIVDSAKADDMDMLELSDIWKREVEKNSTPEKRLLAHKMVTDALLKVAKQKKKRRAVFGTTIAVATCLAVFLVALVFLQRLRNLWHDGRHFTCYNLTFCAAAAAGATTIARTARPRQGQWGPRHPNRHCSQKSSRSPEPSQQAQAIGQG